MGSDICLPVAKYSHAIGLRDDNTVPWTHVSSSNLFVIVKGTDKDMQDEKLVLRVVQASEVLESLDVGTYIDNAIRARHGVQRTGTTLLVEQLPIFGITKDTILAIRYRLSDGQSRRLQTRMHSAADCRQLVHAFESRGMEFSEQRSGTGRPSTARPITSSSQVVPPHTSSAYFFPKEQQQHRTLPLTAHVIEAGSLSQASPMRLEHKIADRGDQFHGQGTGLQATAPKTLMRDEASAPREVVPTRPSTAQIYRSHTLYAQPSIFDSHDIVHQAHKAGLARPSSTSNTAGTAALSHAAEQFQSPPQSASNNPEPRSSILTPDHANSAAAANASLRTSSETLSDQAPVPRPATASSSVFAETLEHEIPPRRELPFARPESRRSVGERNSLKSTSTLTLPPLPKPRPSSPNAMTASGRPSGSMSLSPNRPHTSSPLKRSFADMNDSTSDFQRPSTASPVKPLLPRIPSPQAPSKTQSPMEELLQNRKLALEKSSAEKIPRADSLADAPGEEDDSPNMKGGSQNQANDRYDSLSPVRREKDNRDAVANAYAAICSNGREDGGLAKYADQSLADRQAALDEFMVQNLENPAFTKLCQDVENCWRRIALGL